MPYETPLRNFDLVDDPSRSTTTAGAANTPTTSIRLEQPADTPGGAFKYEIIVLSSSMVRVTMGRVDGLGTVEGGLKRKDELGSIALDGLKVSPPSLLSIEAV